VFGGAALSRASHAEADRALELLLEYGVNHLDTAASYGDSELRIASWLKRVPGTFFLGTKTGKRDYRGAKEEIRRSLDRLGVDRVDLIQLHNLVDVIEWEQALREGGALEAAVEAREEGLVRFIGVTGHGLSVAAMHRRSLERFRFDSVLLPYNYVQMRDERYASEFEALARTCIERGVALQTIKSIALAPWDGRPQTTSTWYEPLQNPADIELAVHWVLGRPTVFLNTASDIDLLPFVLSAAQSVRASPDDATMRSLVERRSARPLFV
jgi:aryl-alcohol dehydrogenase-like predicted oxidoreductase